MWEIAWTSPARRVGCRDFCPSDQGARKALSELTKKRVFRFACFAKMPSVSIFSYKWYYSTIFMTHARPASAPSGRPARQPDQQPDRHHQGGAKQEVAPQPADGVESHIPDFADQLFDAAENVPRIEPDRRENNPNHDRQQHEPHQHRERRAAEEAADQIICHRIVIPPLHSGHRNTSPAAILRAC